jgi:hypothetical protein
MARLHNRTATVRRHAELGGEMLARALNRRGRAGGGGAGLRQTHNTVGTMTRLRDTIHDSGFQSQHGEKHLRNVWADYKTPGGKALRDPPLQPRLRLVELRCSTELHVL